MSEDQSWTPEENSGIENNRVAANGLEFEVLQAGAAGSKKLAICLHGFPELHFSWRHQMPALAADGWRVWAPNLRGYGASSRPKELAAYEMDHLLADVGALIDEMHSEAGADVDEVMLVSHDWGGVIAWQFAIRKIRPLTKLIIMNVPHPHCLEAELKHWRQLKLSWYIFFFQIPWLPEKLFGRNKAEPIGHAIWKASRDKSKFPADILKTYSEAANRDGALTAMINYYRANFRGENRMTNHDGKVDVPTLMLWGEDDDAINIHCLDGTDQYVSDLTLKRFPGVSHWVQQEIPDAVNKEMIGWLAT